LNKERNAVDYGDAESYRVRIEQVRRDFKDLEPKAAVTIDRT
jgi:hypothetical protein